MGNTRKVVKLLFHTTVFSSQNFGREKMGYCLSVNFFWQYKSSSVLKRYNIPSELSIDNFASTKPVIVIISSKVWNETREHQK